MSLASFKEQVYIILVAQWLISQCEYLCQRIRKVYNLVARQLSGLSVKVTVLLKKGIYF